MRLACRAPRCRGAVGRALTCSHVPRLPPAGATSPVQECEHKVSRSSTHGATCACAERQRSRGVLLQAVPSCSLSCPKLQLKLSQAVSRRTWVCSASQLWQAWQPSRFGSAYVAPSGHNKCHTRPRQVLHVANASTAAWLSSGGRTVHAALALRVGGVRVDAPRVFRVGCRVPAQSADGAAVRSEAQHAPC